MDSAILNLGTLRRAPEMQLHFPDHFVSNEPSTRRAKSCANRFHPKTFGQIVKRHRGISKKARAHPRTETGLRMPDLLPQRAWLASRLAVEFQFLPATDELHAGARF